MGQSDKLLSSYNREFVKASLRPGDREFLSLEVLKRPPGAENELD